MRIATAVVHCVALVPTISDLLYKHYIPVHYLHLLSWSDPSFLILVDSCTHSWGITIYLVFNMSEYLMITLFVLLGTLNAYKVCIHHAI